MDTPRLLLDELKKRLNLSLDLGLDFCVDTEYVYIRFCCLTYTIHLVQDEALDYFANEIARAKMHQRNVLADRLVLDVVRPRLGWLLKRYAAQAGIKRFMTLLSVTLLDWLSSVGLDAVCLFVGLT
jgi:hypothetical protein